MKKTSILALLLTFAFAASAVGQQKVFDWVRASEESVQLDPADYHTGRVYRPGPDGGNIHVIIRAAQPVTLAMAWAAEWNNARQNPELMANVQFRCVREHVVDTTYECHLPGGAPMVLTIHDERTPDRAVVSGIGALIKSGGRGARQFASPNDVAITYHSWLCTRNCIQPEFQWVRLVKEKYELSSAPKIYTLLTPERDGQQVSVRIKAPVPMMIAVVPAQSADQLYKSPDALEDVLTGISCKQRGVQSLSFECKFNAGDGPQSLIVRPESVNKVPRKKAEIELQAVKCVANCALATN